MMESYEYSKGSGYSTVRISMTWPFIEKGKKHRRGYALFRLRMHVRLGLPQTQAQAHHSYVCNVFAFVTLVMCSKPCVETKDVGT